MKVDKNIPVPTNTFKNTRWPWPSMDDGDSFFVPAPPDRARTRGNAIAVSGQGWCARNKPGFRTLFRQEDGGVRVWMVKATENAG